MGKTTVKTKRKSGVFKALTAIALVFFAIFAYVNRGVVHETYLLLLDIEVRYVILLPLIQITNYFFIGNYYRTMFSRFDVKIHPARAWGVVAAMNFVNQVLPSGGLSGISYLAYGFHARISTGKTTLIQMGRYMAAFGSYVLIAPVAIFWLFRGGNSGEVIDIAESAGSNVASVVTLVAFVAFSGLVILLLRSEAHTHKFSGWTVRAVNVVVRPFRRGKGDLITQEGIAGAVGEFHEGVRFFKESRAKMIVPLVSMFASALMEMLIVYVALRAVGMAVDPSVVYVAFVAANVVGVVSVIPGDVGVHEAVVIFVLGAFLVPVSVALSATLLYRVFNKMIFLPIGFYFYTHFLKPASQ